METDILIRKVIIKDSEEIANLSSQLGYPATLDDMQNRLQEIIRHSWNCAFAAVENEKVIGWIHAFYITRVETAPFVEIAGLVIDENYRGKHTGRKLVAAVKDWCLSKGVTTLRVRSNALRYDAHEFYKHIGFTEIKSQKVFDLSL